MPDRSPRRRPGTRIRGCCSAGVGFEYIPAGDDVAGGEVFEHDAGDGVHIAGVYVDKVAGLIRDPTALPFRWTSFRSEDHISPSCSLLNRQTPDPFCKGRHPAQNVCQRST